MAARKPRSPCRKPSANSSYLEFFSYANQDEPARLETYPYDFTVEPILHYLAVAIRPVKSVSASGTLRATANLATGLPAPDGLPFNLAVTWPGGGVASYTGVSSGGVGSGSSSRFPKPPMASRVSFVVSHPADGAYQGVTTSKLDQPGGEAEARGPHTLSYC